MTAAEPSVTIVPLSGRHAREVAELHCRGIHTGFLSSLGPRFLTQMYAAIPSAASGFGFVAEREGRVIGFIACAERLGRVYKQTLKARAVRMALGMLPRVLNPRTLLRVIETLFYPARMETRFPPAEVLSIVAAPEARGSGVAAALMQRAFEEFRQRGIDEVKVQVWTENAAAKRFYEKCGFSLAGQKTHHQNVLDVYTINLSRGGSE